MHQKISESKQRSDSNQKLPSLHCLLGTFQTKFQAKFLQFRGKNLAIPISYSSLFDNIKSTQSSNINLLPLVE